MIIISHRGNVDGLNPQLENSQLYIDKAIKLGYDVEIDLRCSAGKLYLGHDSPQYPVAESWLEDRIDKIWLHIKDYDSLVWVSNNKKSFKYFCHESDKYTLTSNGYIWSHDLNNKMTNKCIVPLLSKKQLTNYNQRNFYAVCTDYAFLAKKIFNT